MAVERVWLIRHGLTDWNAQHRWQGHTPTALNAEGHEQARKLAAHLQRQPIGMVYTSDLPRAFQTARAVAAALELEPVVDARFREVNVGIFQALFPDELAELYPDELARWRSSDLDYAPPGGESRRAMQARVMAALDDVTGRDGTSEIAVVSHGGTIRQIIRRVWQERADASPIPHIPNTSYTVLERSGDGWETSAVAETPHLPEVNVDGKTGQAAL